jgi:hypothetical protein
MSSNHQSHVPLRSTDDNRRRWIRFLLGGHRQQLGRLPRIPRDTPATLVELDRMCLAWRRWHAVLAEDQTDLNMPHVRLADLPIAVRNRLAAATVAIRRLEKAVTAKLAESRTAGQRRRKHG